ncbi:conjugative transposon protein TraM [Sphingobacterium sp. MYb388]|uniref:conjugative transposon protein TraM n=1 Tax=Sphingobacterium sp. MYb388 TaxID=2745437 RepID=UPI0030A591E1
MEQEKQNKPVRDRRKFLLVLPLLVLPFISLGFYALGGGKGIQGLSGKDAIGLNATLPDAPGQDKEMLDKMSFYDQAEKDSIRRMELARQDPYYLSFEQSKELQGQDNFANDYMGMRGMNTNSYQNPNEEKVYSKLSQLNKVLADADREAWQQNNEGSNTQSYSKADPEMRGDIDRLEQMMQSMQSGQGQADPEMAHINSVLENVLDIQHPERVQERLKQQSKDNTGQVFAVAATLAQTPISLLDNRSVKEYSEEYQDEKKVDNRFFGLDGITDIDDELTSIAAVVHETQTLVSGATVKLRLTQDVFISGRLIPKDHFIYGTVALQGERLQVQVESIRYEQSLFPVKLFVHDMDGLPGIHIPGAITRDVAKQSGDQAIQGISLGTMNPSIGAQAASAGIELGRNLLSKKIKLIKVEVKAGYKVLLRDGKKKDQ